MSAAAALAAWVFLWPARTHSCQVAACDHLLPPASLTRAVLQHGFQHHWGRVGSLQGTSNVYLRAVPRLRCRGCCRTTPPAATRRPSCGAPPRHAAHALFRKLVVACAGRHQLCALNLHAGRGGCSGAEECGHRWVGMCISEHAAMAQRAQPVLDLPLTVSLPGRAAPPARPQIGATGDQGVTGGASSFELWMAPRTLLHASPTCCHTHPGPCACMPTCARSLCCHERQHHQRCAGGRSGGLRRCQGRETALRCHAHQ